VGQVEDVDRGCVLEDPSLDGRDLVAGDAEAVQLLQGGKVGLFELGFLVLAEVQRSPLGEVDEGLGGLGEVVVVEGEIFKGFFRRQELIVVQRAEAVVVEGQRGEAGEAVEGSHLDAVDGVEGQ